ncbi:hypothetical protein ABT294_04730 [Nonomuraea sp. NPDC000554]|uniref:hypothetical protein n=1 Tax=Nonomuraea sp. NPDC000554 TaxID=3154259 RepID=UPI003321A8B8
MSYGETDELALGDDEEPRLPRWAAAHRRLLAIVTASVVLLGALAVGGWHFYQRSLLPSPPPDGPFPAADGFAVLPCLDGDVGCPKGTVEGVLAMLRGMPEVASVAVRSAEEIRAANRASLIDPAELAKVDTSTVLPDIEGRLRRSADFGTVKQKLTGKPGISGIFHTYGNFWKGKADLAVSLCVSARMSAACVGGPATVAQRDAVVARLRGLDGVEEVFLQDREFGLRLAKHDDPERYVTVADVPEVLYVRFDDPGKARAAGRGVLRMPGVGWVNLVK